MRRPLEAPAPAKLVVAVMWQESELKWEGVEPDLARVFGPISSKSDTFEFSKYTPYYEPEMGAGLLKCFVEFAGLHARDNLVRFKRQAFVLEEKFMRSDARLLNLDPMIVTLENIVISTSKNFTHRIYLGDGVFGDLALLFRKGRFEKLAWTYPDYADRTEFFAQVRAGLLVAR